MTGMKKILMTGMKKKNDPAFEGKRRLYSGGM